MADRNAFLDAPKERQHDALKAVAGLITKLSYRDMEKLGRLIGSRYPNASAPSLTYAILETADELLGNPFPT